MNKNNTPVIAIGMIIIALLAYIVLKPKVTPTSNNISPASEQAVIPSGSPSQAAPIPSTASNSEGYKITTFKDGTESSVATAANGKQSIKWIKATFRDTVTGTIFTYNESMDTTGMTQVCITDHCKIVYFKGKQAVDTDTDNVQQFVGTVTGKAFHSSDMIHHTSDYTTGASIPDDENTYTISYNDNGVAKQAAYEEPLCHQPAFSGGYECTEITPLSVGESVLIGLNGSVHIVASGGPFSTAAILNYQYYWVPDFGKIYPVITVQK